MQAYDAHPQGSRRRVPLPAGFGPFPREALARSIPERFADVARRWPDGLAVVAPDGTLTYEALGARSQELALSVADAAAGDGPVGVMLGLQAALPVAILGVLASGRPYVALDPAFPDGRLARTVERCGASAIVACKETRAAAGRIAGEALPLVDVDAPGPVGTPMLPAVGPDDLAYVYYTSGSTGEPKGVEDTHRNVLHNVMRYTNTLGLGPGDRLTLLQRPSFSGSVSSLFGALLNGATSCLFDLRAAGFGELRRWLADERITVYHSVPSIFREVAPAAAGFEAMRVVRLEGDRSAPVDLELFDRHFPPGCVLVNGLGATECGLVRQYVHARGDPVPEIVPVGYAVEDMEVAVVAEDGSELPVGTQGEVVVRSAYLALGYRGDPARTAERFAALGDGVREYRTGDHGLLRPNGCLELLGRVDRQPRFRGQLVEVEAIERSLVSASLAVQVAVRVHERPGRAERLVAYVVPPPGATPTTTGLRARLARDIPESTIPTDFLVLDALPVDENGKVAGDLPPPGRDRPALDVPYHPPRSPLEAVVASAWAEVLDLDRVGVLDSFRDLGGDSLAAAEMLAELGRRLGEALPHGLLLRAATVEALADAVNRELQGDHPPPVVRLRDGDLPSLVLATGDILGGGRYARDLAARLDPGRPVIAVSPFDPEHEDTPGTVEEMADARLAPLRALLPSGPCVVAGYCGPGGLLACELARGLARAGVEVALLVLVDTFPPSPRLRARGRPRPVRAAAAAVDRTLRLAPRLRHAIVDRRACRRFEADAPNAYYRGWPREAAYAAYDLARARYEPRTLPCPLHVLWPEDEPDHPPAEEFRRGWGELATRVDVTAVRGDHIDVVTGELDALVAALEAAIAVVEPATVRRA